MYLVPLKSAITEAMKRTFNSAYPVPDFQNLHVSIEYPNTPQNYPGVWINYEDTGPLKRAGIDHHEVVTDLNGTHIVTRWEFEGSVSFTVGALTSLERDRIYDELVRILAFAKVDESQISVFRDVMESNDFIGTNLNYDVLNASGDAAQPGTPWGTDEIIYERTLSTDVIGEFVSDPTTNSMVLLSAVQVMGYREGDPVPNFPDNLDPDPNGAPWDPNNWS